MGQKGLVTRSQSIVAIGRIGAPFGVKGWVHVYSYTDPPQNLLNYKTWCLYIKKEWKAVSVLQAKGHGKGFVALLEGYEIREEVALLTNIEVGIEREALPELGEGEYYWTDLIGLTVVNEADEILGTVDSLFETGANDVLVVKGETKEHLIPYVPDEYILEVDLALRRIRVSWDAEF